MTKKIEQITPLDHEMKLTELGKELKTVSGAVSLAKKASPSLAALMGMWFKRSNRKATNEKALIEIQLFPKIRKYLFKPTNETMQNSVKKVRKGQDSISD